MAELAHLALGDGSARSELSYSPATRMRGIRARPCQQQAVCDRARDARLESGVGGAGAGILQRARARGSGNAIPVEVAHPPRRVLLSLANGRASAARGAREAQWSCHEAPCC